MKKMLSLLFCILLMMSAALAVAEEAKPLEGKKLTIALSPNFMFFETVSETEECGYEGLDIDIIKELSDMLGFDFEIVPMSFSSLVGSLQAKSVDMVISGMSYTEERAQIVDFSDVYCTAVVGCVTKVDSELASFDDLKNQIVCCVPESSPLAKKKAISMDDVADTKVVMLKEGSFLRQTILGRMKDEGITPNIVLESNQINTLKGLVANGVGITFLLDMVADEMPGLKTLPLADPIFVDVGLAWKKDRYISKAAQSFIDFCKDLLKKNTSFDDATDAK